MPEVADAPGGALLPFALVPVELSGSPFLHLKAAAPAWSAAASLEVESLSEAQ